MNAFFILSQALSLILETILDVNAQTLNPRSVDELD
jgi:hypothetical protein